MKKVLVALSMALTLGLSAQEAPKVTSAIIALYLTSSLSDTSWLDRTSRLLDIRVLAGPSPTEDLMQDRIGHRPGGTAGNNPNNQTGETSVASPLYLH